MNTDDDARQVLEQERQERALNATWEADCIHWHGRSLTGRAGHYCYDWDQLPIDETCCEFDFCACPIKAQAKAVDAGEAERVAEFDAALG